MWLYVVKLLYNFIVRLLSQIFLESDKLQKIKLLTKSEINHRSWMVLKLIPIKD
jgi:hypothetical protein